MKVGSLNGEGSGAAQVPKQVTARAILLGLLLAAGLSGLNSWMETVKGVHFLGGTQMPSGAIFGLLFLILAVNIPIRFLASKSPALGRIVKPFSPTELLTMYLMLLFAALISTPGTDNFFLTIGPALFYFSNRENGWADLFYKYMPKYFAPGWDGNTYQEQVINKLYVGGVGFKDVPWHAWTALLMAWSLFLLLTYALLFFVSLIMRRQWIEHEALSFPLVQLPIQMVEVAEGDMAPPAREFWCNRFMWGGAALALVIHGMRGLNFYFPDFPPIASFHGNTFYLNLTERPWNVIGGLSAEFYLGAIGIAYLITKEMAFSFWFFFILLKLQLVFAQVSGFEVGSLPRDSYMNNPLYITYQSVGGWGMMAVLLLWSARGHLKNQFRDALQNRRREGDPFSARFSFIGLVLSFAALMGWCSYAGLNPFVALTFLAIYSAVSLVLARLVVEGGFLFPQQTFAPLEIMNGGIMGSAAIGNASLAKMAFFQPVLMGDMRANTLPAWLHVFRIAHDLKLESRAITRLSLSIIAAIVVSLAVSLVTCLVTLYSAGGFVAYGWLSQSGPQSAIKTAASAMTQQPGVSFNNVFWMIIGGITITLLTLLRARYAAFPLHPLGYLVAPGYPMAHLWFSFFVGWGVKTLILKYGGSDTYRSARPFFIGLILGNACAMMLWMIFGFYRGNQIPFWAA